MEVFDSKPDFVKLEHEILKFWEDNRCFEKLMAKNRGNIPFRFLDGPITANNSMGIHHAWGRTLKDAIIRYKAMRGYSCSYRNGFDTQGLWVEVEVEKELGFKNKKDIETYGTANFTKKCVERVTRYSGLITEQSKRLGQWMDWNNSYFTHTDQNIEGIWAFLKKCHENGWLVQANRPIPWCPRCGTSLSEHEMTGSYRELLHTAVFVKLPLLEKEWDILVWTTTPWTLAANVALAVNPETEYCLVKCEGHERPLLLAKSALKQLKAHGKVVGCLKGNELAGLHYETCFPFLAVQKTIKHKIVLWDAVSADEGSGVVHIAPGCGAEDFELGQRLNLPAVCTVDEQGVFFNEYGPLTGLTASEAAPAVFSMLEEGGRLYKTHSYRHSYPVCWRCKTPVLFRMVSEWYVKTGEVKQRLLEAADKVKWEPEYIGKRMRDWLTGMGDWNISRKRYYGLPLPFYPCRQCGKLTVIGSRKELLELADAGSKTVSLPELHRPWIDAIHVSCPVCGTRVDRVSEVGDVWLDAGIVPFTTQGYFEDRDKWKFIFPAEWVTEMREQVRLWFYSLLFMGVTLEGTAPYERVLAFGSVVSEDGSKFSKTGYMIRFDEAAEKLGADAIRYLFAGSGSGSDVRFGYKLGEEARSRLLDFWNIYVFFMTYAALEEPDIKTPITAGDLLVSDRWLLARTNAFLASAAENMDAFNTQELIKTFESFINDVSNWYIRISRRRFWEEGQSENKRAAFLCLYKALKAALQVMAPVIPFLSEFMWQKAVRVLEPDSEESVHLSSWPSPETDYYRGKEILKQAEAVRRIIGLALKIRNEKQLKVKQPLSCVYIIAAHENVQAAGLMSDIIKDELNVKRVDFLEDAGSFSEKYLTLNFRKAGADLKDMVQSLKLRLKTATKDQMSAMVDQHEKGMPVMVPGWQEPLDNDYFVKNARRRENVAVAVDGDITVAVDTEITGELAAEGLYRELLRQCQLLRKEAGLKVDQRIALGISSESEKIRHVIGQYSNAIAAETLSFSLHSTVPEPIMSKKVSVGEFTAIIELGIANI